MEDLLNLKRQIEQLGKELARDEGSLAQLIEQLQEQGYRTIEDATEALKQLEADVAEKEAQLSKRVETLNAIMSQWEK